MARGKGVAGCCECHFDSLVEYVDYLDKVGQHEVAGSSIMGFAHVGKTRRGLWAFLHTEMGTVTVTDGRCARGAGKVWARKHTGPRFHAKNNGKIRVYPCAKKPTRLKKLERFCYTYRTKLVIRGLNGTKPYVSFAIFVTRRYRSISLSC